MASQPSHDDAVASFMSVTAVGDAAVARRCLESCSFNVEEAIGLFFSMGADAFAVPPPAPAAGGAAAALPASSSSSGGTSEADARAIAAVLAEDADEAGAAAPMRTRSSTSGSPAVRAPDAVKRQRLMVGSVFQSYRAGPMGTEIHSWPIEPCRRSEI